MNPVELRTALSAAIRAFKDSWHRGPRARRIAATAIVEQLAGHPWLGDQIPADVRRIAERDATIGDDGFTPAERASHDRYVEEL